MFGRFPIVLLERNKVEEVRHARRSVTIEVVTLSANGRGGSTVI